MRIALASTGLGHIARGVEAWSKALAEGLGKCGGNGLTGYGGEKKEYGRKGVLECRSEEAKSTRVEENVEVTLFAAGKVETDVDLVVLPCLRRGDKAVRLWTKLAPDFAWRWGWKAPYSIEQKSFANHLIPYLKSGKYDVVHTQDPVLALELEAARKRGDIQTPVILAHGTADSPEYLSDITYMQHLCLDYREKWVEGQACEKKDNYWISEKGQYQFCIPNFIDVERFTPRDDGQRNLTTHPSHEATEDKADDTDNMDLREKLGVPEDAFVVGCSAALQFNHKRLDYLIKEISAYTSRSPDKNFPPQVSGLRFHPSSTYLLLAGASTDETPKVEQMAKELLGDKCIILKNLPFNEMPEFFRTLDLYIHPAYDEFYGISILEAMSAGLPVIAHASPSLSEQVFDFKYMDLDVSPAGCSVDMLNEGAVSGFLEKMSLEWIEEISTQARQRAETMFSWEAVKPRFLKMYWEVVKAVPCFAEATKTTQSSNYSNS